MVLTLSRDASLKLLRFAGITVAFLAASVHAEIDLSPQLVFVGESVEGDLSIDMNSLVWAKPNNVTAWLLLSPSFANEARKSGASFIRLKAHLDCTMKRYYISTWVAFKADGTTLMRGEREPPDFPLQPVPPNLRRERLISIACKKK